MSRGRETIRLPVYFWLREWYKYSMAYHSLYLYFLTGGIALITLSIAYRLHKTYPLRCLSYYFYYLILFNMNNFVARPIQLLVVETLNLTGPQAQRFFVVLFFFVIGPLFITWVYLFIKFAAGLVEVQVSKGFKIIYFLYWGVLYVFKFILVIDFFKTRESGLLSISSDITDLLSIVILFSIPGFVFSKAGALKDAEKQTGFRTFASIYFLSMAVFNLSFYISGHLTWNFILSFAYVLPPLIYLSMFFRRYYREHPAVPVNGLDIGNVLANYNISAREQEIIRYISLGKTNYEIADLLFVSLQTVKQHTYNIYRKLKVKNRVQLSNFIRNAAASDAN